MPYKDPASTSTYYRENRKRILEYKKKYYELNKSRIRQVKLKHYENNKEVILTSKKFYYVKNCEMIKQKSSDNYKKYYIRNKKAINLKNYLYKKMRRETDLNYRLREVIRSRLSKALTSQKVIKNNKTEYLLGNCITEVKKYLEKNFKPGMSWENYGEWHIDHIIPCASFDLTKLDQQKKCFHYTNLQPLWKVDNLRKGAKVPSTLSQVN